MTSNISSSKSPPSPPLWNEFSSYVKHLSMYNNTNEEVNKTCESCGGRA